MKELPASCGNTHSPVVCLRMCRHFGGKPCIGRAGCRHDPCFTSRDMRVSARLRSSVALVLIALLCGTPVPLLARCASDALQARHSSETTEVPLPAGCHDSGAPDGRLSCCCDERSTMLSSGLEAIAIQCGAESVPVSFVNAADLSHNIAAASTAKPAGRHRQLFSLFSTFRI